MNNINILEKENGYEIKIISLLEQLQKIKNIIELKRVLIFETEIENFAKEMEISYDCSKKIISTVYLDDMLQNIYSESYLLIEKISTDILENYNPEKYYMLKPKDYFILYQKSYN